MEWNAGAYRFRCKNKYCRAFNGRAQKVNRFFCFFLWQTVTNWPEVNWGDFGHVRWFRPKCIFISFMQWISDFVLFCDYFPQNNVQFLFSLLSFEWSFCFQRRIPYLQWYKITAIFFRSKKVLFCFQKQFCKIDYWTQVVFQ